MTEINCSVPRLDLKKGKGKGKEKEEHVVKQEYGRRSPPRNKNVIMYERRRFRHNKNTRPTQDEGANVDVDVDDDDVSIKTEKDHLYKNKNHEMPMTGLIYVTDDYFDVKTQITMSSNCDQCSLPFTRISGKHMPEESEVQILDIGEFGEKQNAGPFVSSKKFHPSMFGEDSQNVCDAAEDEFRAEVLAVLRKPFDNEEYMKYREEIKNGSYLDHHSDLKRRLKKHRYKKTKCMVILRGFFFWLQNLTREGSFRPWEDKECLAVEPLRSASH